MPLRRGSSKEIIASNIRELRASGHSQTQSVAIALDTARRTGTMAKKKKAAKKKTTKRKTKRKAAKK